MKRVSEISRHDPALTEKEVVALWERTVRRGQILSAVDTRPVRVLYPGRPSSEPGADFQDAVVDIGGHHVKGNIEVHVRSADWKTHGHHLDAAYNGIVLHVVMWHDGKPLTGLESGSRIPVVALHEQSPSRARSPPLPCHSRRSEAGIAVTLDRAGDTRFREKEALFYKALETEEDGECLYRGIMEALGYTRNREPFQVVAEHLPLFSLERGAYEKTDAAAQSCLEALLLGTAGFLPSQRGEVSLPADDPWVDLLEREWRDSGNGQALTSKQWRLFRVRPGNHPARRLAGMAHLLWRYRKQGLFNGLVDKILAVAPQDNGCVLEEALTVGAEGYWSDRFDFGKRCKGLERLLIGRARAAEIAVNVLLPFTVAWAEKVSHRVLAEKARMLYETQPAGAENAIERHMREQLGISRALITTARRQQGLLHLYKRYCTEGRCGECAL